MYLKIILCKLYQQIFASNIYRWFCLSFWWTRDGKETVWWGTPWLHHTTIPVHHHKINILLIIVIKVLCTCDGPHWNSCSDIWESTNSILSISENLQVRVSAAGLSPCLAWVPRELLWYWWAADTVQIWFSDKFSTRGGIWANLKIPPTVVLHHIAQPRQ